MEKVTKNDLTVISKSHAHTHTMKKTHAKFLNDRYNTVEELHSQEVSTVYMLSVKNDYVHNVEKVTKKALTIISKQYAHSHTMKIKALQALHHAPPLHLHQASAITL